jgi:glycine/D-amino acid oxidase-like deaminating enzyme
MNVDFLIIGQGLAGSLLGWELIQQGQRILVVDPGQENASLIAGGLINPVTGMRLVKADNIKPLLASAFACYQRLEQHFKQCFYLEKPMLRLIRNDAEKAVADKRLADAGYRPFLGRLVASTPGWKSPFGLLEQQQTGYLQTRSLLTILKNYFIDHNSFRQNKFDYNQLKNNTSSFIWQDVIAQNIIFCEGYHCADNPWFSWLPMQAVKGEILTFTSSTILPDKLFNYGHWLIPTESAGTYRTGATFNHQQLNTIPTETAKQQLLASLYAANSAMSKAKVIAQHANIRPCTLDKQAFIGRHPEQSNLIIFNGFGAKGSLLIPWHSHNLIDHLIDQKILCPLANINRYHGSHFSG